MFISLEKYNINLQQVNRKNNKGKIDSLLTATFEPEGVFNDSQKIISMKKNLSEELVLKYNDYIESLFKDSKSATKNLESLLLDVKKNDIILVEENRRKREIKLSPVEYQNLRNKLESIGFVQNPKNQNIFVLKNKSLSYKDLIDLFPHADIVTEAQKQYINILINSQKEINSIEPLVTNETMIIDKELEENRIKKEKAIIDNNHFIQSSNFIGYCSVNEYRKYKLVENDEIRYLIYEDVIVSEKENNRKDLFLRFNKQSDFIAIKSSVDFYAEQFLLNTRKGLDYTQLESLYKYGYKDFCSFEDFFYMFEDSLNKRSFLLGEEESISKLTSGLEKDFDIANFLEKKASNRDYVMKKNNISNVGLTSTISMIIKRLMEDKFLNKKTDIYNDINLNLTRSLSEGELLTSYMPKNNKLLIDMSDDSRVISLESPNYLNSTYTISNLINESNSAIYQNISDILKSRLDDGKSFFVFESSDSKKFTNFIQGLNKDYVVEGVADIDGTAYYKEIGKNNVKMLVLGRKRPVVNNENEIVEIKKIDDISELWAWSTQIILSRQKIDEYYKSIEKTNASPESEDFIKTKENILQVPYIPATKVGKGRCVLPKLLENSTNHSLNIMKEKVGSVENYVLKNLNGKKFNFDLKFLEENFSPEQIDALGLTFLSFEDDFGFLLGDDTGVGKTRVLIGTVLRSLANDDYPIVFTEDAANISDFVLEYRRMGLEKLFNPLVLNEGLTALDEETGDIVIKSPDKKEIYSILETFELPKKYNFILGTYSLFDIDLIAIQTKVIQKAFDRYTPGDLVSDVTTTTPEKYRELGFANPLTYLIEVSKRSGNDMTLILDESHNITKNNKKKNIIETQRSTDLDTNKFLPLLTIVPMIKNILYSSATAIDDAKDFMLYMKILPSNLMPQTLVKMLKSTGRPLNTVLTDILVKNGRMIRREKSFIECVYDLMIDKKREEINVELTDRLAPILSQMAYLLGDIQTNLNASGSTLGKFQSNNNKGDEISIADKKKFSSINFNTPLSNLIRVFSTILLKDFALELAIKALKDGKKPAIIINHMMESVLKDFQNDFGNIVDPTKLNFSYYLRNILHGMTHKRVKDRGEYISLLPYDPWKETCKNAIDKIIDKNITKYSKAVDYKSELLNDITKEIKTIFNITDADLDKLTEMLKDEKIKEKMDKNVFQTKNEKHEQEIYFFYTAREIITRNIFMMPKEFFEAEYLIKDLGKMVGETSKSIYDKINKMIDELPTLEINVADFISDKIIEAGFTVSEYSDRKVKVSNGKIVSFKNDKHLAKNNFNNGKADAIILDKATGVSLDDDERYAVHGQRVVINLDAPLEAKDYLQLIGRFNRYNQISAPIIYSLTTGGMDLQLIALRDKKLEEASVFMTSNPNNKLTTKGILNLYNPYGNQVCTIYSVKNPHYVHAMGMTLDNIRKLEEQSLVAMSNSSKISTSDYSISTFYSRMSLLNTKLQRKITEEMQDEYRVFLQEKDALGANTQKTSTLLEKIHFRESIHFDGEDNALDEFSKPVLLRKVILEHNNPPIHGSSLEKLVDRGLREYQGKGILNIAEYLERNRDDLLIDYKGNFSYIHVDELIKEKSNENLINANNNFLELIKILKDMKPGSKLSMTLDGIAMDNCIVININAPTAQHRHLASAYDVDILIPGKSHTTSLKIQTLMKDSNFKYEKGLGTDVHAEALKSFNIVSEGQKLEQRYMLEGNLWLAMLYAFNNSNGYLTSFLDSSGQMKRAVLISKKENEKFDKYFSKELEIKIDVPFVVQDVNLAKTLIDKNYILYGEPNNDDFRISLCGKNNKGENIYNLRMPGKPNLRFNHFFGDKEFLDVMPSITTGVSVYAPVPLSEKQLNYLLNKFRKTKITFFFKKDKNLLADYNKFIESNTIAPIRP